MDAACKRPRVAFVVRRFGSQFGGLEAYAEHLVNELRNTFDIHVFCQVWGSDLPVSHTLVPQVNGLPNWLNLLDFTWRCHRLTQGYDLIHSHENSWLGTIHGVHMMPVRFSRFHCLRPWHSQLLTWISPRLVGYLLMEAMRYRDKPSRKIVAVSPLTLHQVEAAYRRHPEVTVIPPGVHMPGVRELSRAEACRLLGLRTDRRYAILVAHEPVRKGLRTLLEALPDVSPDLDLIVVGGFGGMAAAIRDLTAKAGLSSRVHVWPLQRDMSPFYTAADICTFLTSGDAFGMVPLEAMSYGLPVIISSSRYCGLTHYITHETNGMVIENPEDAKAAGEAINRILSDKRLYEELSLQGKKLAETMSWKRTAEMYSRLYETSLAATRA